MSADSKPPRFKKVKRGSSLRVEIHLSNFYVNTMTLTCEDHGHLNLMLMSEAAREPIPTAPNQAVQNAFDCRAEYSRIRGGFGRTSLSVAKRRAVFERDGQECQYCGAALEWSAYHCDHIEPASKGGSDALVNLAASCVGCNLSKKDRSLSQWRGH